MEESSKQGSICSKISEAFSEPVFYIATIIIVLIPSIYFFNFHSGFSDDQGVWAQFGDFFGGVVNPLLAFLALITIVRTLKLQQEELKRSNEELSKSAESHQLNVEIQEQLSAKNQRDTEERYLFLLIEATKESFKSIDIAGNSIQTGYFEGDIETELWGTGSKKINEVFDYMSIVDTKIAEGDLKVGHKYLDNVFQQHSEDTEIINARVAFEERLLENLYRYLRNHSVLFKQLALILDQLYQLQEHNVEPNRYFEMVWAMLFPTSFWYQMETIEKLIRRCMTSEKCEQHKHRVEMRYLNTRFVFLEFKKSRNLFLTRSLKDTDFDCEKSQWTFVDYELYVGERLGYDVEVKDDYYREVRSMTNRLLRDLGL